VMPEHSLALYQELAKRDVPVQLFLHQGGHGGDPPFRMMNRWFTRFLFEVENGVEDEPRSWIVRESGRGEPTSYPDWPHPGARAVTLRPGPGGRTSGALGLAEATGQEKLVDDASVAGPELAKAQESKHRLLYATPKLAEPLHVSGTARVHVRLASSKRAANLSVWLVSLPWSGDRRPSGDIVTRGWADPQNHASLTKSEPLERGRFVDVTFDLQPDDQVIASGEQLGLMIFSSDREFTLWPEPGTELTIDLAGTWLELPVVGGDAAFQRSVGVQ
jgi:X-Pro dipeptidyl-peptidase